MHDIKEIRNDPEQFAALLKRRGHAVDIGELLRLDRESVAATSALQNARTTINSVSDRIAAAKRAGKHGEAVSLIREAEAAKREIPSLEAAERQAKQALTTSLSQIPNLPHYRVPDGQSEAENIVLATYGEKPVIENPRDHVAIGEGLGLLDSPAGAALAGSRFTVLRGDLARLSRALGQFMIDLHTTAGFEEIEPPFMVHPEALFGTGQLPKFRDDLFTVLPGSQILVTADGRPSGLGQSQGLPHYLIPTAEVPLTNLHADRITPNDELPRLYTALTPCFRAEAGAAGRDTRGLIRQHQFMKCELVAVVRPEASDQTLNLILGAARAVLDGLELPYRTVALCAGDLGASAAQTIDIEVWFPGQGEYREISSVSACGDFQARRMNARYRDQHGAVRFVHTLNGSGVAVGRALIAILENHQQPDGSVVIPKALRPYMGNREVITRKAQA